MERPFEHLEVPELEDGWYRTTYPTGPEHIQHIKDNHNNVDDTVEKEVKFFGAQYERVYILTQDEYDMFLSFRDQLFAHRIEVMNSVGISIDSIYENL